MLKIEIINGVALGGGYYLMRITDGDETRDCWLEDGEGEILPGDHYDDGDTLNEWGASTAGDWVGRYLIVEWTGDQDENGIPGIESARWA